MERTLVKGPLYNIDLEWKNAKQAEARLSLQVQRLEDICLYRMKSLAWEQRQLQKELQKLQQEILEKRFSSDFKNGILKMPRAPIFLPQRAQKNQSSEPKTRVTFCSYPPPVLTTSALQLLSTEGAMVHTRKMEYEPLHQLSEISPFFIPFPRALGANVTPENHKTKHQMRDPLRGKEYQRSPSGISACLVEEEEPSAREEDSVTLPESISVPCQDQKVSASAIDQEHGSSPADDCPMTHAKDTRSLSADPKLGRNAGQQILPEPMDYAESFQEELTNPTYVELFAKVKHAHYLRHKVPPESERLLSTEEIFGHGKLSWS